MNNMRFQINCQHLNFLVSWIFGIIAANTIAFYNLFNGGHCPAQNVFMIMYCCLQLILSTFAICNLEKVLILGRSILNYTNDMLNSEHSICPDPMIFYFSYTLSIIMSLTYGFFCFTKIIIRILLKVSTLDLFLCKIPQNNKEIYFPYFDFL